MSENSLVCQVSGLDRFDDSLLESNINIPVLVQTTTQSRNFEKQQIKLNKWSSTMEMRPGVAEDWGLPVMVYLHIHIFNYSWANEVTTFKFCFLFLTENMLIVVKVVKVDTHITGRVTSRSLFLCYFLPCSHVVFLIRLIILNETKWKTLYILTTYTYNQNTRN